MSQQPPIDTKPTVKSSDTTNQGQKVDQKLEGSVDVPSFNDDKIKPRDEAVILKEEELEGLSPYWSDSNASNCEDPSSSRGGFTSSSVLDQSKQRLGSSCEQAKTNKSIGRQCNKSKSLAKHQHQLPRQQPRSHHHHHHHHQQPQQQQQQQLQQHQPGLGRHVRKRVMANERERERTKSLNQALEILRNKLPVPEAEKRSKIQTLRMAKIYIEFLANSEPSSMNLDDRLDQLQLHIRSASKQHNNNHNTNNCPQQHQSHQHHQHNRNQHHDHHLHLHPQHHNPSPPGGQLVVDSGPSQQPDSPLTYKFYKFRLMKQTRD